MPKYKILFEYDGSDFNGWQRQKNSRNTIQEVLESSFYKIISVPLKITAAGRTDAGVHALNHIAHFTVDNEIKNPIKLIYSVNSVLPNTIVIKELKLVRDSFHARYSAKKREYIYKFTTVSKAIEEKYYYKLNYKLDFSLVDEMIEFLKSITNFRSLCKNSEDKHNFACRIYELKYKINKSKNEIIFDITADRFLHSMVRAIMGCLVDVGRGKLNIEQTKNDIKNGTKLHLYFLPGKALFLKKVFYK